MDTRKPTLKDIAKVSGYSLASVHRAINKKEGVSESVQKEILDIAAQMGYTTNYLASTLKRKPTNVAIVLPEAEVYGKHYFSYMWNACHNMCSEVAGYNMNILEFPFECGEYEEQNEQALLEKLYLDMGDKLDGLLIAPTNNNLKTRSILEKFIAKGVTVVLIDNDFPDIGRLCCIAPSDVYTGRLGAECLTSVLHGPGTILVASGDEASLSHSLNNKGFRDYIEENNLPYKVMAIDDKKIDDVYRHALHEIQEQDNVVGLYSVRARFTAPMARAAVDSGKLSQLCLLGSDLFTESAQMLKDGILKGIVYKNPYQKGYLGMKVLFEHLIKGITPKSETLLVPISIIFQNNLRFFEEFI